MSTVPPSPYASPDGPQKGSSGTKKVLLGVFIGLGLVIVLCCGGGVLFTMMAGQYAKNAVVSDPVKIKAGADAIAKVNIPADMHPQGMFDAKIPFTGKPLMTMAAFANEQDRSIIMVGEFNMGQGTNAE